MDADQYLHETYQNSPIQLLQSNNKPNCPFFLINVAGFILLKKMLSCPSSDCPENISNYKDYLLIFIQFSLLVQLIKLVIGNINEKITRNRIYMTLDSLYFL